MPNGEKERATGIKDRIFFVAPNAKLRRTSSFTFIGRPHVADYPKDGANIEQFQLYSKHYRLINQIYRRIGLNMFNFGTSTIQDSSVSVVVLKSDSGVPKS